MINLSRRKHKRKVLIIGLPYFADVTAKRLRDFDPSCTYLAVDSSAGIRGAISFVIHVFTSDIVYMIGGSATCGGALKLTVLLKKPIVMHWVGTDVLIARKTIQEGKGDPVLLGRARHLCDAEWLRNELCEIGIEPTVKFLSCIEESAIPIPLPRQFSILSYIGKGREKFYGIDRLIALALQFPEIPIEISTLATYDGQLPPNIRLLGYVPSLTEKMKECVLFLRLPEHDGFPFTVVEAMNAGRYVGYIHELPGAVKVTTDKDLFHYVADLHKKFENGRLEPNYIGYQYVCQFHSMNVVMQQLVSSLQVEIND